LEVGVGEGDDSSPNVGGKLRWSSVEIHREELSRRGREREKRQAQKSGRKKETKERTNDFEQKEPVQSEKQRRKKRSAEITSKRKETGKTFTHPQNQREENKEEERTEDGGWGNERGADQLRFRGS